MKQSYTEETGSATSLHRDCFACGHGEDGLGLTFERSGVDTVSAEWFCDERYQSYPGIVHGGIIATVLDCAMTNCLLMKGIPAVTADMHIEYREPVRVGSVVAIRASLVRSRSPLFVLEAEIIQDERVRARASAKFMCADVWSDMSHV
ncbi:MAG: PaaI family thioesterase [Armatimonadota bacterium]